MIGVATPNPVTEFVHTNSLCPYLRFRFHSSSSPRAFFCHAPSHHPLTMRLGIVGGSSLVTFDPKSAFGVIGLTVTKKEDITAKTAYGDVQLKSFTLEGNGASHTLIFMQRHSHATGGMELKHGITPPHKINYHANMQALKDQNVDAIIATSSVGACLSRALLSVPISVPPPDPPPPEVAGGQKRGWAGGGVRGAPESPPRISFSPPQNRSDTPHAHPHHAQAPSCPPSLPVASASSASTLTSRARRRRTTTTMPSSRRSRSPSTRRSTARS
jgi:hypothetical protein